MRGLPEEASSHYCQAPLGAARAVCDTFTSNSALLQVDGQRGVHKASLN